MSVYSRPCAYAALSTVQHPRRDPPPQDLNLTTEGNPNVEHRTISIIWSRMGLWLVFPICAVPNPSGLGWVVLAGWAILVGWIGLTDWVGLVEWVRVV